MFWRNTDSGRRPLARRSRPSSNYRYAKKKRSHRSGFDERWETGRAVPAHNAGQWGIDPERIALYGDSAGAGMSVWIGLQDDMADPDNTDPVLRKAPGSVVSR